MKTTLVLLIAIFSLSAFSQEVVKETWTCKNNNLSFTAVVTEMGVENKLSISYQWDAVVLTPVAGQSFLDETMKTELEGEFYQGHDLYNYKATLTKGAEEGKGKLVIISDMFLDCLGQRVETDMVNCKIVIERK
ncbi:MAG: hypothetical protein V4598_06595 [Bdellovibrionota bacterium]